MRSEAHLFYESLGFSRIKTQITFRKTIQIERSSPTQAHMRDAHVQDAEAIARVHVASWQSAYRGMMPDDVLDQLSVSQRTDHWKARLQSSSSATYVLELDQAIIGFASFGSCRDSGSTTTTGELYGIYLDPAFWSKRLGAMLYLRAETAMRSAGYTESHLWVLVTNERARQFYLKAGYMCDGRTKATQRDGVDLVEIRFKKALSPL